MNTKKRLGRGLDALLSGANHQNPTTNQSKTNDQLSRIPIEQLQRGRYQPRSDMRQETLDELANSIQSQGIVQPLVVRQLFTNENAEIKYEIIAGERRWRAAQIAGLAEVPVVIKDIPDSDAIAMSLIENIQRENLNPLEEALALDRLIREFELTHQEAADAVGRSRASVSNLLRLIELPEKVAALLISRKIDMGHARAILSLKDPHLHSKISQEIIKKGLSVRATEKLIRKLSAKEDNKKRNLIKSSNPDIQRLELSISEKLGAKLNIDHKAKGNGRIIIRYNSLDELEGIIDHIK